MVTTAERLQAVRASTTSGTARSIRLDARLSLHDVASSIGVDCSTVARWERGERLPRGAAALRYAALLDRLTKAAA
jgi:DNA-binding transcriptional regulator YiaG